MSKEAKRKKPKEKRKHPSIKSQLHPRSKHRNRYNFPQLIKTCPELASFVAVNAYGDESIDFFNPAAVKALNKALLMHHYGISYWELPNQYLCPPIPGRADYIHHMADVLAGYNQGEIPKGSRISCLDIGVGANCVYPLLGHKTYGWSFVGSEIDQGAIATAQEILDNNSDVSAHIKLRLQSNASKIFSGVIQKDEFIDLCVCNPPFHASQAEAMAGSTRKLKNLKGKKEQRPVLNFSGQSNELWCEGGELRFVGEMIRQSREFASSCFVFSSLVSKAAHLKTFYKALEKVGATDVKTIPMGQGNKVSRILVWTYLKPSAQKLWRDARWR